MYFKSGDGDTVEVPTMSFKVGLLLLAAIIIYFGIFPQALLSWFYF